jgi:hypothetical protein
MRIVAGFAGCNAVSQKVHHTVRFFTKLNSQGREALMRVRIRKPVQGFVEGVSLSHLVPGVTYDLPLSLGGYLVSIEAAEAVPSSSRAISIPLAARDFSKALGGVRVTQITEAADKPKRKRTARRKKR